MTIRSYAVTVGDFDPVVYHRRTPAQARMAAWNSYLHYDSQCSFRQFLSISSITRVPSPAPVGELVTVCGKPAELISLSHRGDPEFMYVGSNTVMRAHYSELVRKGTRQ